MTIFDRTIAEKLNAFLKSELWSLMKRRIFVYIDELEKRVIIEIQNNNKDSAFKYAHMSCGIKEAIKVAERLSGEIMQGKFDVDGTLHVMRKNAVEKERKESWIKKILGLRKGQKKQ